MIYFACVVSLILVWTSSIVNCQNISFSLQANWSKTPFKLNVLEAVSDVDNSLYEPLVLKLLGIDFDIDNNEYNIIEEFNELDDAAFYLYAKDLLNSDYKKFVVDMKIANVLNSPRIQAQVDYYNSNIKSGHKCNQDAFIVEPIGTNVYCDKDAAFMLQNHDNNMLFTDFKLSFDRMLGSHVTNKTYFIYGDFRDEYFRVMFFNMYQFVHSGKINLVWRYVDAHPSLAPEILSGYSVDVIAAEHHFTAAEDVRRHVINQLLENKFSILRNVPAETLQHYAETGIFNTADNQTEFNVEKGIYINDAKLEGYDFLNLIEIIGKEILVQEVFRKVNIDLKDSLKSLKSFTGNLSNDIEQYEQRYQIFKSPAIAFLNDIEKEPRYSKLENDDSVYRERFVIDDLPKMKQNIHQVIFIIDITQPEQINKLLEFYDVVFNNYLPIQVGVVPVVDSNRNGNMEGISKLYGTRDNLGRSKTHSYLLMLQRFLYSYRKVYERIFDEIMFPDATEDSLNSMILELKQLSESYELNVEHPLINVNGVFFELNDYESIFRQINRDSFYLHSSLMDGKIPHSIKMKSFLRRDSISLRNENVFPSNFEIVKSQILLPPNLEDFGVWIQSGLLGITKPQHDHETPITFNLIGSFENADFVQQVKEALTLVKHCSGIRLNIFDGSFSENFKYLMTISQLEEQIEYLQNEKVEKPEIRRIVENKPFSQYVKAFNIKDEDINSYIVISGRKIKLNRILNSNQLISLACYERLHRLRPIWQHYRAFLTLSKDVDIYTNFELFSWAISYSSYNMNNRNNLPFIDKADIHIDSDTELINIKLVTDLSTTSQEWFHVIELMKELDFVSVDIYFMTSTKFEESPLTWSKHHMGINPLGPKNVIEFDDLPQAYEVDVKTPSSWIISTLSSNSTHITYELRNLVVDAYLKDSEGNPMMNIPVGLLSDDQEIIEAYYSIPEDGYVQLKTSPGQWKIELEHGSDASILFDLRRKVFETIGFEREARYVSLKRKKHFVNISFNSLQPNASILERVYFKAQHLLHRRQETITADVNIFSIPTGTCEQKRLLYMIASVMKHTSSVVKFWIYDELLSAETKNHIEVLSKKLDFRYEYVYYQWPSWLPRPENKKQRAWGIQHLFLDTIFPTHVEKIVIISPIQIIKDNVMNLNKHTGDGNAIALSSISPSDIPESVNRDNILKQVFGSRKRVYVGNVAVVDLNTFRIEGIGAQLRQYFVGSYTDIMNSTNIVNTNQLYENIEAHQVPSSWLWCNGMSEFNLLDYLKDQEFGSDSINDFQFADEIMERQTLQEEIDKILNSNLLDDDVINHDEL
ncbi:hypothetical protein CANINC_004389 [Pichia inconspicua]|uniref:Uncharacterized protein n=1 Tax=Pichia inconspicua TaxID=52247 RepID=A0A4T0WWD2_9ASCO|nr:hypothetical protein CANINC_004389 [[Candida] inconspicua]